MLEQPRIARRVLDECGFPGTELHLNEWHYFNADWRQYRNDRLYCREANRAMDGLHGIDSAAFLTSVMTGWQDGPITMGCYYTAGLCWGVFDKYAVPYKTYYALKAFGDLTDFPQRRRTGSDRENVRLLAGCDPGGNAALLVSSFKNAEPIELGISGADLSAMQLLRLDCELDLEPVEPEFRDGKLILTPTASSNVWFSPGDCCRKMILGIILLGVTGACWGHHRRGGGTRRAPESSGRNGAGVFGRAVGADQHRGAVLPPRSRMRVFNPILDDGVDFRLGILQLLRHPADEPGDENRAEPGSSGRRFSPR